MKPLAISMAALICTAGPACAAGVADDVAVAQSVENAFVSVAQAAGPAVVSIATSTERTVGVYHSDPYTDQIMQYMFGRPQMRLRQKGLGSGMIINKKGFILTNTHVVDNADEILVILPDGRTYRCEVVGADTRSDIAVIRITDMKKDDAELPVVTLGDSDAVKPGQWAIGVGNPFGISEEGSPEPTVTVGAISAVRSFKPRNLRAMQSMPADKDFSELIQTDAAINPGNSGGPLCNIKGEVIGINTFIVSGGAQQNAGVSFAVPINKAKLVVDELVSHGRVQAVWLGLEGQDVDERIAHFLGLDQARGMLIADIHEKSVRDAGVNTGEVVRAVNGVRIEDRDHYLRVLRNFTISQALQLELLGSNGLRTVNVSVQPFTDEKALAMAEKRWGLTVAPRGSNLEIIQVRQGSPAQKLGLQKGDILLNIAGDVQRSVDDFALAFKRYRMANTVLLLVARDGQGYYVRLRV